MNHRMEDLPLCLSSLYIRLSNEKIIKINLKKKKKKVHCIWNRLLIKVKVSSIWIFHSITSNRDEIKLTYKIWSSLEVKECQKGCVQHENHFFFKDLFLLFFFYWKGGYTERRDREEDLPSDDSFPKWAQWPMLCRSKARRLFRVSHAGAGSQSFGPSLTAFLGRGRELEGKRGCRDRTGAHMGSGACKARILTTCATTQDPRCSLDREKE